MAKKEFLVTLHVVKTVLADDDLEAIEEAKADLGFHSEDVVAAYAECETDDIGWGENEDEDDEVEELNFDEDSEESEENY